MTKFELRLRDGTVFQVEKVVIPNTRETLINRKIEEGEALPSLDVEAKITPTSDKNHG